MLICNAQKEAETLFAYYEKVRNVYYGGSRNCMINVGPPFVEYNGTLVASGFLAVYVTEDDNHNAGCAQTLGMETRMKEGKFEHQFVIRKKFSTGQKREVLQIVAKKLQQVYGNDYFSFDKSVPFIISLTDMKDIVSSMQK